MPHVELEFAGFEAIEPLIRELEEKYRLPNDMFVASQRTDAWGLRRRLERQDPLEGAFDYIRWATYSAMGEQWVEDCPRQVDDMREDMKAALNGAAFSHAAERYASFAERAC